MLIDSFFRILDSKIEPQQATFIVEINKDDIIFNGHFSNCPIVPGVYEIQMACELLSFLFKKKMKLKTCKNVKFQNIIDPREDCNLQCDLSWNEKENDQYALIIDFKTPKSLISQMSLVLTSE